MAEKTEDKGIFGGVLVGLKKHLTESIIAGTLAVLSLISGALARWWRDLTELQQGALWGAAVVLALLALAVVGAGVYLRRRKAKGQDVAALAPTPVPDPSSFTANVRTFTVSIPLGDVCETPGGLRIEVCSIDERAADSAAAQAKKELGAELVIKLPFGFGWPEGGSRARKATHNRFYLPVGADSPKEACLYFLSFSPGYIAGYAFYIDHVNPHSKIVTINGCIVNKLWPEADPPRSKAP